MEHLLPQELLTLNNARNCFHLGQTEFDSLPSDMTEACDLLQHFGALQLSPGWVVEFATCHHVLC